jgi:hypothetical protein
MHELENAALTSIGRACGFAWLAIMCIIFAFSFQPPLAALAGGLLCVALTMLLGGCAWYARYKKYDHTELWLILPVNARPPAAVAQRVIGRVLRDTYLWFAKQAAIMSIVFLALGVIFRVAGLHELPGAARANNIDRPFPAILVDDSESTNGLRIEIFP